MFQIKYNNIFLDMAPNQDCEIERNSPLFLIDNFFAEYSTPITLAYSDNNAKALGYYFFEQATRTKIKIAVEVYDKGTYKCNAILALESAGMNNLFKGASTAGGYLLLGISDFLQTIQTKKLNDLKLGGNRTFNFTTWDPYDSSNGYFQHFHATWNGTYDYVFTTCRNDTWTGSADDPFSTGYMNTLDATGATIQLKTNEPVVPFVYVKFIIESIFKESGWSVDFTGLNDNEWQKLLLWSVIPLYIASTTYHYNETTSQLEAINSPLSQVTIKLADYMPQDYTCAQFLVALCLRYGWAIIPSTTKRTARIVALKEQKNKVVKDWTQYAASASASQITVDEKIFAFKQDFEGNDNFPNAPDFTNWTILNGVNSFTDLPNPVSGGYDNALIYVYNDNQYYQVVVNEDATARIWQAFADNIYDKDAPEGVDATDTFETKCTTLPVYKTLLRTVTAVDYFAYFPLCEQSRTEKFGIKTLLYHGLATEIKDDGTAGTFQYPFASSTHTRHDGGAALTWSNVYNQINTAGTDFGIIEYWFQTWLDMISNVEDAFKKRYYLPLTELLKFQWDDIVLDRNIAYVVKQIIEPLPYKGFVECTMQRINLSKNIQSSTSTTPPQTVYLRISFENYLYGQRFDVWENVNVFDNRYLNATTADIIVRAYSDDAGTIPLTLSGFAFKTQTTRKQDATVIETLTENWVMDGNSINVNLFFNKILEADYDRLWFIYTIPPNIITLASWHILNTLELLPDPSYTIIP